MDVSQLFKGQKLDVDCPNCNTNITFDASLAFKSNSSITCPNCSPKIQLENIVAKKLVRKTINDFKNGFK
jgi:ribosomal protein S27E